MHWGHPDTIFLYFLLPLLLGLLFYYAHWQKKTRRALADPDLLVKIMPNASPWRVMFKNSLKILAFVFLVFALMEPKWGMKEEEVTMHGINLMVLVDVSNSMLSQDVPPSRLEREKRKFKDLINMLAGDRVGLIAFAGRSFLMSPLTVDYGTLELFTDELSPETIPIQGTDLAGAIQLALKALPEDDSPKALMLFSDGEDHSERMEKMLQTLKEKNIKVFAMGIGTPQGAPIPQAEGGFKSTPEGQMVVSKLEEGFLKNLALETGGAYVRTVTNDDDLKELYIKGVRGALNANELKASKKKIWESRFYWPLAIALVFLFLERLIPEAKKNAKFAKSTS